MPTDDCFGDTIFYQQWEEEEEGDYCEYQDQAAVRNLDSKFPLERGLPPRFYIVIRQTKCSSAKSELLWKDFNFNVLTI